MMHYGYASFEIFWIIATIIFEGIFTFALNIFPTSASQYEDIYQKAAAPSKGGNINIRERFLMPPRTLPGAALTYGKCSSISTELSISAGEAKKHIVESLSEFSVNRYIQKSVPETLWY